MFLEPIVIVLATLLGFVYHFANQFDIRNKSYHAKIVSLSAGISITYLILELFPTFTAQALSVSKLLFLTVLFGFIVHHLIEKNIYRHHHTKHELIRLLSIEENIFNFAYHFVVGILLVFFLSNNVVEGALFFFPIVAFTLVNSLTTQPHESPLDSVLNASSTLLGVLFTLLFYNFIPQLTYFILLGIVTGVLLYSITRHHVPYREKGEPSYFIFGFLFYAILIVLSWYI